MTVSVLHHRVVGPLDCNCYIVGDAAARSAIVIDPGGDAQELAAFVVGQQLSVTAIIATHAHFDHVIAARSLHEQTGAPFYLHPADEALLSWMQESGRLFLGVDLPPAPEIDEWAKEGDRLKAGSAELEIIHTPGHSSGSISLVASGVVFSGDTLFAASVGRTDLPGGDTTTLVNSIRHKLFELPPETRVYPGHGPDTTVERERRSNPFVREGGGIWSP